VNVGNDDVVASTTQRSIPTATGCLNLSIPSLERDPGEYAPVTFNGYAAAGGAFLGPFAVPGPGFSTGKFAFSSMPNITSAGGPPICTVTEAGNNCAQTGGIEGDVCLPLLGPNLGFCYFGECGFDPNSPCALRFSPATLAVRDTSTHYVAPQVGVHITSPAVLDAYRGHFSTKAFASAVDFRTNDGKVWVVGRDSFWGMPGMNMNPYLMYHPVEDGVLGEPQYFAGMSGKNPVFSPDRTAAQPLYLEDKMVTHHASFAHVPDVGGGVWVMLYGGHIQPNQRPALEFFVRPVTDAHFYDPNAGIYLRWAKKPWGPWSPPITIFNAFTPGQGGYCANMYFDDPEGKTGFQCPAAAEARNARLNRVPDSGHSSEYAPVILPRFTKRIDRDKARIHWLLTSSNPYRVMLMRSDFSIR
jgi:hypothetical protein